MACGVRATVFCLICVIVIDTAKKRLNYAPLHSLTHARAGDNESRDFQSPQKALRGRRRCCGRWQILVKTGEAARSYAHSPSKVRSVCSSYGESEEAAKGCVNMYFEPPGFSSQNEE